MQIALPVLRDPSPLLGTADTSVKMCRIFFPSSLEAKSESYLLVFA